jgi:hypothetical protein
MQKILSFLFIYSSLFASQEEKEIFSSSDLEPHSEFSIHQDPHMRVFYVRANDEVLGTVLNSKWGQFDFYDGERKKRWTNSYDSLFDDFGHQIGELVWEKDPEMEKWFWERERFVYTRMSYINIYNGDKKELLATFHPFREGNEALCVFSDGQTKQPLAIAYWFWTKSGWFSPQLQNWQIYIVDRPRLQERNISDVFLIWVLLKHSQDHFSFGPNQYNYVTELPPD